MGKSKINPIPPWPLSRAFASARHSAAVKTSAPLHGLRQQHCPLLESPTEMRVIQVLPGPAKPRHRHFATKTIRGTVTVTAMLARVQDQTLTQSHACPEAGVLRLSLVIAETLRADIPERRSADAGHVSLSQIQVMSAIAACQTG